MHTGPSEFDSYFAHLKGIRASGRIYKKYFCSPILYMLARRFGKQVVEVGSGTGSGVLGAFPNRVCGLDVNPHAVRYCREHGLDVQLIPETGVFPIVDGSFSACILDNVLEHIADPRQTIDECHRITTAHGGLVIAVPGLRGYDSDPDHRHFYDADQLRSLDSRWGLTNMFSTPFGVRSELLSRSFRQYCLVATYRKVS